MTPTKKRAALVRARVMYLGLTIGLAVGSLLWLFLLVTFPGIGLAVICVGGPTALLGLFWWSEKRQNRE